MVHRTEKTAIQSIIRQLPSQLVEGEREKKMTQNGKRGEVERKMEKEKKKYSSTNKNVKKKEKFGYNHDGTYYLV